MVIIRLSITPSANRNTYSVATPYYICTQGSVLRPLPWAGETQLHYLSAAHCAALVTFGLELPVMCTVCAVLSMPLSGVKSLFTLMGRLGWGTLLVTFVVEFVSSSNSVGVALSQPRVAGVVRYPG